MRKKTHGFDGGSAAPHDRKAGEGPGGFRVADGDVEVPKTAAKKAKATPPKAEPATAETPKEPA